MRRTLRTSTSGSMTCQCGPTQPPCFLGNYPGADVLLLRFSKLLQTRLSTLLPLLRSTNCYHLFFPVWLFFSITK
jgi:hypothetical protein